MPSRTWSRRTAALLLALTAATCAFGGQAHAAAAETQVLRGTGGVVATFARQGGGWRWTGYRDEVAGREWTIDGERFSLQTGEGQRTNVGTAGFATLAEVTEAGVPAVVLETELAVPPVFVRQTFAFAADGRTLRCRAALRATGAPLVIQRVGLLELRLPGQTLKLMGPGNVSSPVFGDRIFAGIEHPAALCQAEGEQLYLAQHSYIKVGTEWVALSAAVFGSSSSEDEAEYGREALRRAFLRYLDTVRVKPADLHIHYNNWWTMPVPFSEADVLANIAALKRGLAGPWYRLGGPRFFFDSYAMDMGWSDPHTVWEVDRAHYPAGFRTIGKALAAVHARPGLWVSPSSCYPPALDNDWLEANGYETLTRQPGGRYACLALGGRYQRAFKEAVLRHAREGNLGHVKFDGLVWPCETATHGHPTGIESMQPIAEGLMDVFDALRQAAPTIALEPTCLGYWPSPWWLMHTPYVIGPFGDDCPNGRSPCPEWIEALTTGRDVANLQGRDAFLLPSAALECFDIIVQSPGDVENHGVMAVARGHGFQSTYINPKYMDADEWRFFADLMRWARANREFLQEPLPVGGDPAQRQAYGYAYRAPGREMVFARNPWIEPASLDLPQQPGAPARDVRLLYPRREVLGRTAAGVPLPALSLGPYELAVLEAVPVTATTAAAALGVPPPVAAQAVWSAPAAVGFERLTFAPGVPAFGPDWSSPDGDVAEALVYGGAGVLRLAAAAELCLLASGPTSMVGVRCVLQVDGKEVVVRASRSAGAFSATGAKATEDWAWFLASLKPGTHAVEFRVLGAADSTQCGVFVRGWLPAGPRASAFGDGPQMPLYRAGERPWSQTLVPLSTPGSATPSRRQERRLVKIDGVYLDSLPWDSATTGWGEAKRNLSVMGTPLLLAGRTFARGIGTHATSRIVYTLPPGYRRFVATIGCDQEVQANSVVFAVEGDGRTLFRSPVMRRDTPLREVDVSVKGVKTLTLVLEDAGDGIGADHGDWADARVLR
jgi:hypothetical protein